MQTLIEGLFERAVGPSRISVVHHFTTVTQMVSSYDSDYSDSYSDYSDSDSDICPSDSASRCPSPIPGPPMALTTHKNGFQSDQEDVGRKRSLSAMIDNCDRDYQSSFPQTPCKRRLSDCTLLSLSSEEMSASDESELPKGHQRSTSTGTLIDPMELVRQDIERLKSENELLRKKIAECWATFTAVVLPS
jgi:hypothetical protein